MQTIIRTCIGLVLLLSTAACFSQTITNEPPVLGGPGQQVIQFLGSGTNWSVGFDGIYDTGSKKGGGGILAACHLSDYVVAVMGLDCLASREPKQNAEIWMPSATIQLQAPFRIMNKLDVTPLAYSGITTSISGRGDKNGEAVGIVGAGASVRAFKSLSIFAAGEKRSGFDGQMIRGGAVWRF